MSKTKHIHDTIARVKSERVSFTAEDGLGGVMITARATGFGIESYAYTQSPWYVSAHSTPTEIVRSLHKMAERAICDAVQEIVDRSDRIFHSDSTKTKDLLELAMRENADQFPGWRIVSEERDGMLVWKIVFDAPDNITGVLSEQHCRKFVAPVKLGDWTDQEVLEHFAYALKQAELHEFNEKFFVDGVNITNPHISIDFLLSAFDRYEGDIHDARPDPSDSGTQHTCGVFLHLTENGPKGLLPLTAESDRYILKLPMLVCHITGKDRGRGSWSIPKGIADPGESYDDAAVRETFEETGIHISNPVHFAVVPYRNKNKVLQAFCAWLTSAPEELRCESVFMQGDTPRPEVDDFKWLAAYDAAQLVHETQVEALVKLLELTARARAGFDARPKTMNIFDFDGTLVDTLGPERGKEQWESVTGGPWPHVGWWSKPDSLDPRLGFSVNSDIAKAVNPESLNFIVTNRIADLRDLVMDTVRRLGIEHIEWVTASVDKLTKPERVERLAMLCKPDLICVWEDRDDHIQEYLRHGVINGTPTRVHEVRDGKVVCVYHIQCEGITAIASAFKFRIGP